MQQDKFNTIAFDNNNKNKQNNQIILHQTEKRSLYNNNSNLSSMNKKLLYLQSYLKQQSLMAQLQQAEKRKLIHMIQQAIQKYYSQYAHSNHQGKLTKDQQLGNCYNFVKQICLSISRDPLIGFKLISSTQLRNHHSLIVVIVNHLYQNIAQSDLYKKPINKMIRMLINDIAETSKQQIENQNKKNRINIDFLPHLVSIFCKRTQIAQYFNALANNTITSIMKINLKKQVMEYHRKPFANNFIKINPIECQSFQTPSFQQNIRSTRGSSTSFSQQQYNYFYFGGQNSSAFTLMQFKIQIFQKYKQQILKQAESAPTQLKILLKIIYQGLKQKISEETQVKKIIWNLLSKSYFEPFIKIGNFLQQKLFDIPKKQILNELIKDLKKYIKSKSKFVQNLINKLILVNQQKFDKYIVQPKFQDAQNHINIYSICLNYQEINLIFNYIKNNEKIFQQICPKMIHRLKKLNQMSKNLQILQKNDKQSNITSTNTYLLFTEIHYSDLLTADYLKNYVKQYQGSIKNIFRQVLVQLDLFQLRSYLNLAINQIKKQQQLQGKNNQLISQIFQNKIKELQKFSSEKLFISLLTKIKYMIYIFKKKQIDQKILIETMITELEQRMLVNLQIYQKSKFYLFKTFSIIKNKNTSLKNILKNQKKLGIYLKNIELIQNTEIYLCISAPSTRVQLVDSSEKYKISSPNNIIFQNPQNCLHKQIFFLGMPFHIWSAKQFVPLFCKFKQVRNTIQNNNDNFEIKKAIYEFIDLFKKKVIQSFKLVQIQIAQFTIDLTEIIMKTLHTYLIERNIYKIDLQFQKKLTRLSFIKLKWLKVQAENNLQQLWQICTPCNFSQQKKNIDFKNISLHKTPQLKMNSLKEVIQIIKTIMFNYKKKSKINDYIQIILVYILIKAKPKKWISNLNFIQLFLSQNKLLSQDGQVLKKYRKIVKRINQQNFDQILNSQIITSENFKIEFEKHKIIEDVHEAKLNLKDA